MPAKPFPQRVRVQKSGTTIVVPHPEAFWEWLGVDEKEGLWDWARRFVGLGQ